MAPLSRLSIPTSSVCLAALALTCCTPGQMRKSADREVFGILRHKSAGVPNAGTGLLDISPPPPVSLEELRKNTGTAEFLGDRAQVEKNGRIIPLHEALSLAVKHNRDYQARKELLYLQALDLTLVRNEFTPLFTAVGSADVTRTQKPVTQTVKVPNPAYAKAQAAAAKAAAAAASSGTTGTGTGTTTTATTTAPAVPPVH
ncbi:hypothetical protein [Verrucomicrobium spinosum]|uniref:hypothetical protein n=1 Tax=Verrucomicrobium spinosum TaxID=2736 RepID=UPI0009465B91|nr:hypothetical protein [Verrucomicrobium spinosum]